MRKKKQFKYRHQEREKISELEKRFCWGSAVFRDNGVKCLVKFKRVCYFNSNDHIKKVE